MSPRHTPGKHGPAPESGDGAAAFVPDRSDGSIVIRPASHASSPVDAAACAAIYAPYVRHTAISFEIEPPTAAEMTRRIAGAICWLVAERDGAVVGYAYATRHRERAAYRWACDVSVYVAGEEHGRGVGRALLETLLDTLATSGFRMACAGVALPNPASEGLHRSLGFVDVGVFRAIGWKHGAWHDVLWMQRHLGASDAPMEEPRWSSGE